DGNNVVQAAGQTLTLTPGQFRALTFLGTAVNGSQLNQTFTVNYSDGSSDTFTLNLSDWQDPQGCAGESVPGPPCCSEPSGSTATMAVDPLPVASREEEALCVCARHAIHAELGVQQTPVDCPSDVPRGTFGDAARSGKMTPTWFSPGDVRLSQPGGASTSRP